MVLPPGTHAALEVTYTPDPNIFELHEAFLFIWTANPDGSDQQEHHVHLRGSTGTSELQVLPSEIDFGPVALGCASEPATATAFNLGALDLDIEAVAIEPPGRGFELLVVPEVPTRVGMAEPLRIELRYVPLEQGVQRAELVFRSDVGVPRHVSLRGEGTLEDQVADHFVQTPSRPVDLLFVIDNTPSMENVQRNLALGLGQFVAGADLLNPEVGADFHFGVVTTDMHGDDNPFAPQGQLGPDRGKLVGVPRFVTQQTPDVLDALERNITVGEEASGVQEAGLEAARAALSPAWLSEVPQGDCGNDGDCEPGQECVAGQCLGHNRGFLRDEANLGLVFVSDEEDQSQGPVEFYLEFFRALKGVGGPVRAWAIAGDSPHGCESATNLADAGRRYLEVADATGGGFHSICDDDLSGFLGEIGRAAFSAPLSFRLSRAPDPDSLEVVVAGELVPALANGERVWELDPESNRLVFADDESAPQAGQELTIRYQASCFAM